MVKKIIFILCLLPLAVHADVIYKKLDRLDFFQRPLVTVTIENGIEPGDYDELARALNDINQNNYRLKDDSIYLNSGGGLAYEAKQMGHLIRKHHISTKVKHDDECASACTLILIAGSCRMALGYVGLHRGIVHYQYKTFEEFNRLYKGEDHTKDYILEMSPLFAFRDITYNTPNWDMWWLTDLQKLGYGLMTSDPKESEYYQEVVSRKIAAPKEFLMNDVRQKKNQLEDNVTWYERNILKKTPLMQYPSCTEQLFLHLMEEYPVGTDKWDEQFELYKSWQGYMTEGDGTGKPQIFYVTETPYKPGNSYFWTIDYFLKNKKEITYKEVTTYEKPTKWSDPDGVTVSEGGRVATRIRTEPNNGRISNAWSLDENDSRGKVKVDVYVEDQLIKTFNFEVK
jgi:hypothetical protein